MGPEGPMVHIGACVASVITYMDFKFLTNGKIFGRLKVKEVQLKENLKVLDEIVSDSDHREFVSAGATAGIAAAFGAPVGGVLFAMEEACTFWSKKTAWRCFLAAALSVYTIQIINPV
jgi:chloride channel 7